MGESYSSVLEPDFEQKLKMYENFMPKANVFEQRIKGVICDHSETFESVDEILKCDHSNKSC